MTKLVVHITALITPILGLSSTAAWAQSGSWVLPSSAFATGMNGAEFHTDVRILNAGASQVTVTATLYDQASQTTVSAPGFPVAGRNQASFDNVLQALFGKNLASGSYGPIRFDSTGPIIISSSVNNVNACGTGATSGLWLPGIDATKTITAGVIPQLAVSASTSAGYRTNLVLMNPGSANATATVTVRTGGGLLLSSGTIGPLGANGFSQVALDASGTFPGVAGRTDDNLWVEFTSTQPVLAFASVINNASGDPFAVVATPDAGIPASSPFKTFDSLYPSSFRLRALSADVIPVVAKPIVKAPGLSTPSYIDPVYGTRVYKATDAADFSGASFVRHDYSRRQAFNADNSRFIATSSDGYWLLYDANSFEVLARSGSKGALKGPGGDCEMIWHPSDPKKLWYTGNGGGLLWHEKDVETDTDMVMVDFTGRLPWPQARSVWTKSEGTSSANGRYWAFMATSYDSVNQRNVIYGLFTWDREMNKIIGTYDASNFGGAFPDHISISPSGKYAVPSWAYYPTLGTRAYPLDFSSSIKLNPQSEHSDLAIGPDGEDYYVVTDYVSGSINAVNIATGASFDLMPLYSGVGESYAAHISGKAFGKPGWVVISTYRDSADYGGTTPAPTLRPMYRKIMLVELKPGGRQYNVAHTRAAANRGGYFGEHQATISRDGSRVLFSSNFDDGLPSDFMIGLPSWVYDY